MEEGLTKDHRFREKALGLGSYVRMARSLFIVKVLPTLLLLFIETQPPWRSPPLAMGPDLPRPQPASPGQEDWG